MELRPEFQPHLQGFGRAISAIADGKAAVIAVVPHEFRPTQVHIDNLDWVMRIGKDAGPVAEHQVTGNIGKIGQLRAHDATYTLMPPLSGSAYAVKPNFSGVDWKLDHAGSCAKAAVWRRRSS